MDEKNNGVIPESQTQEMELQPTIPNAPSPGTVPQPVNAARNTHVSEPVDELGSELEISRRPSSSHEPGHAPPQALGSIPEQHPVDPAPEPGHAPPQVLTLEEQLAPQPTLPQEPGQGAANRPIPRNRPLQDLFADDKRPDFFNICVPLYEASMKGDWNAACRVFRRFTRDHDQDCSYLLRCSITDNSETALHIAASAQNLDFVRNLVGLMRIEDVQLQNENGNTALCLAAMAENVEIARIMVDHNPNQNQNENQTQNQNENQNQNRNRELLTMCNKTNMTPLYIAALYGMHKMVTYLDTEMNRDGWRYENNRWVCLKCVETDLFDIALQIFPKIPVEVTEGQAEIQNILGVLARKPSAFDERKKTCLNSMMACFKGRPHANTNLAMELLTQILRKTEQCSRKVLYNIIRGPSGPLITPRDGNQTRRSYPSRVLFVAAEMGNTKFIVELIRKYPDLIWKMDDNNRSIFHIAVSHRHERIYNLLYEIGSMKDFIVILKDTSNGNNMLHLVGKMADKNRLKDVSGAAFQMQRELLWYKEVESMLPASYQERRNNRGKTPHERFTWKHKDLLSDAEKWMRGTASKCMLVATLIATIVFTVAYTVPGGYDNTNGFPVFLHFAPFIVFVVLDAISLFLSIISILVFLSILTSRYAQEDFIKSLPDKLMFGLLMLFLSIMTMMIAFSVSFFVLYRHKFTILAVSISLLALIPIVSYALLHLPLMKDVFRSRFSSRYLFKPEKPMLYHRNPTC